jgi:uncharacterized integral membrane protein
MAAPAFATKRQGQSRRWFHPKRSEVMTYTHTQLGTLMLVVFPVIAAVGIAISWMSGRWLPAIITIIVAVVPGLLFSSLTVEVNKDELRWYFGPGFWDYRLPLSDIKRVAVVSNDWRMGWGIRMAPGFRLYNVSGFDAVELRIGANDVVRIGTDNPQGLADALTSGRR